MSRVPCRALLAAALVLAARAAMAQPPPTATDRTADPVVVTAPSPVVVHAPIDPKVTATFPAEGATIPGGVVILKVVFDQPMVPQAWSYGQADGGAFPHCLATPRLLNDVHSFALLCTVATNQAYAIQINASPDFQSAHGRAAKPYLLHFKTTDQATYDMQDALKQAGLTDADEPIMTWNAAPGGVADKAPPPKPTDQ